MTLSDSQLERYSRNIILQDVGMAGQQRLLNAKVLVIGAGGLGSPALLYLAAAGVGTIGIADGDTVDLSNLQRQVLHSTETVGVAKTQSAADTIHKLNPDVHLITYDWRITADTITDIISDYDFIIDGVDNFATKFLINDACVLAKKPFSHAGVRGFYGQAMTYVPGQGPCYRCIFEEEPAGDEVALCSEEGVLGTLPGILGSIQALEAEKYILGMGDLLTGRILTFDGLTMQIRTIDIKEPRESCPVCGPHAHAGSHI